MSLSLSSGKEEVTDAVRAAPSAKIVKEIANTISQNLGEWNEIKEIMYDVQTLMAKAKCVPAFKQTLFDSGSTKIAEGNSKPLLTGNRL